MSVLSQELEVTQTIKNIVTEIEREFLTCNIVQSDESLITFYVRLLLYDPNWQINGRVLRAREQIQKLINRVVHDFSYIHEPDMITINIQNSLLNTFRQRYIILENRKNNTALRLKPLKEAILEQDTTTEEELTNVFHKIVVYLILSSGMGNPLHPEVYKQSRSVLRSILTIDELKTFLNRPYAARLVELDTMVKVYTGIRIYNNDCGRGGEGLPNLTDLMIIAVDGLNGFLLDLLKESGEKIEILSNAINHCYVPVVLKQKVLLKLNLPENECLIDEDIEYCQQLILVYKQFQEAIQFLGDEITALETASKQDEKDFQKTLKYLHANIVPNFYIHVNLVFPYFIKLSEIWTNFQDTIILMNTIRQVVQNIEKMVKSLKFENNLVKYYLETFPPKKIHDETTVELHNILRDPHSDCEIYKKEDLEAIMNIKDEKLLFQYKGHCCWTLVLTNGFLIKGDAKYGIVRFNGRYFMFSSPLALKCFITNPEYFINHVLHLARNRCGFIHFLKLTTDLVNVKDKLNLIKTDTKHSPITYAEVASQVENERKSWIDRTYKFSLWKYKAEALHMATIKGCKTVSTMTGKTFFKNSMPTQTYSMRQKENMTAADKYTNTPTPLVFLHGLRGDAGDKKQSQLNLTFWDFKPFIFSKHK